MTAMTFAIGALAFWMKAYLELKKVEPLFGLEPIVVFGIITAGGGLVGTLAGGWAGDALRNRFPSSYFLVSAVGLLVSGPAILLFLVVPFPASWIFIFTAVFFLFFNTGPTNTILANVVHPSMRATAFAANILVIHLFGDAFSPPIVGAIADRYGLTTGFVAVSAFAVLGGLFWLWGTRHLAAIRPPPSISSTAQRVHEAGNGPFSAGEERLREREKADSMTLSSGVATGRFSRRTEVLAWAFYDWANSAYSTILITILMHYVQEVVFPGELGPTIYAGSIAVAMLLVAMVSPIVGALADLHRSKRQWLAATALGGAFCALLLGCLPSDQRWAIAVLLAATNFLFDLSLVPYNGFLEEIADERTMNRVSAFGFALGYLGGSIPLVLAGMLVLASSRLGLDTAAAQDRAGILIMGLWWGLFSLPRARRASRPRAGSRDAAADGPRGDRGRRGGRADAQETSGCFRSSPFFSWPTCSTTTECKR